MKILFITANRVGDAVLTTGLLAWMVEHYPGARFTIACGPYGKDLFVATPRLDKLIVMKKKKFNGHWLDLWKQCIGTEWDLIVDIRNSIVSRLLRAKKRAIHKGSSGAHKVVDNGAVLGLNPPPDPHIWITPEATREASRLLPDDGTPILALGPAANWPPKQWPVGYFIEFVRMMTAEGAPLAHARVMILADAHERSQIEPLLQSIPEGRRIEIIGRDLQTAAACLKRARLYVGNDSGLMHMSAALGTPTLGLFGPGYPDVYGPWGKNCALARTPETRAQLIAKLAHPGAREPNLMDTLTVENAVAAAKALLARTA
ncbi:MAG: glycosyltransferase family 9 protein [Alphaproteobacteria bacterium]|nr:glycosyltransferase family 9 protein [Alphaproteobacteria bacterium]